MQIYSHWFGVIKNIEVVNFTDAEGKSRKKYKFFIKNTLYGASYDKIYTVYDGDALFKFCGGNYELLENKSLINYTVFLMTKSDKRESLKGVTYIADNVLLIFMQLYSDKHKNIIVDENEYYASKALLENIDFVKETINYRNALVEFNGAKK